MHDYELRDIKQTLTNEVFHIHKQLIGIMKDTSLLIN